MKTINEEIAAIMDYLAGKEIVIAEYSNAADKLAALCEELEAAIAHQSAQLAKAVEALENLRGIGADIVHGDVTRSEGGHSIFQIAERALAEITRGE